MTIPSLNSAMQSVHNYGYRYGALNTTKNQIRVLRITAGDPSDELRCIMDHISLDQPASYQALSYSWHDATLFPEEGRLPSETLQVDDKFLKIGKNIASFLRMMRMKRPDSGWWFIDSVCINQADVRERNSQVHRMRQIYQMATQVIVWLGPLEHDSNRAVDFLKAVFTDCPRGHEASWFAKHLSKHSINTQWKALTRVLWRTWWTRIWSVLEIVVAKEVTVLCGPSQLSWAELEYSVTKIYAALDEIWEHVQSFSNLTMVRDRFDAISRLAQLRRRKDDLTLLEAFNTAGGNHCADTRDKIFAFLGLVDDADRYFLSPDYTMSAERVFRKFFINMVLETGDLDFLSLVQNRIDEPTASTLPTWCPDTRSTDFNIVSRLNPLLCLPANAEPKFAAAAGKRSAARTDRETIHLYVPGLWVDTVDGVYPGGFDNPLILKYTNQPESLCTMYNSDKLVFEAIWKSFVGGMNRGGRSGDFNPPASFGELFARLASEAEQEHRALIEARQESAFTMLNPLKRPQFFDDDPTAPFATWYKYNREAIFAGRTLKSWIEPHVPSTLPGQKNSVSHITVPVQQAFATSWTAANSARRMGTTDKGYIGMLPELTRRGDIICVLFGSRMPVVLRPKGRHYLFIGECYVHGIMGGECMNDLRKGLLRVQEFELH